MPQGNYTGDAICPFYRRDEAAETIRNGRTVSAFRVCCEGIVDRSSIHYVFQRREDYALQASVFCCDHYDHCEIYRMLMAAKYEEEDERWE